MKEMESKMNNNSPNNNPPKTKGKKEGDYIDYEEVR